MSPVNEDEPIAPPSRREVWSDRAAKSIGASDRMPIRVFILFVTAVACVTLAPVPANLLGVAAVVLLAIDSTQHRR
jgi:hypothetical protein